MKRQKEMENAMLAAHRQFVSNLDKGLQVLEEELNEASNVRTICTDEWCKSIDNYLDELHKDIFAISEPRWGTSEDSGKIKALRKRVKDLYAKFLQMQQ